MRRITPFILLALLVLSSMTYLANLLQISYKSEDKSLVRVLIILKGGKNLEQDIYDAMSRISASKSEEELDTARRILYLRLYSFYEEAIRGLLVELKSLGGRVIHEIPSIGAVSAYVPADKLDIIKNYAAVSEIIRVPKVRILMDIAAKTIYAYDFWNAGWNGSKYDDLSPGIEVAVVDTGISKTTYLAGKIVDERSFVMGETPPDLNGHGTKVAHIIASTSPVYRGISYGAKLINAKALNKNGEGFLDDVIAAIEWALTQAVDTAEIINLSIGTAEISPDGSSKITRFIDKIVYTYKALAVIAVGNVEGSYTRVNVPGDTFNGITVGAIDDRNTEDRSDDVVWINSCMGPTADGRIKPDVIAPGVYITTYTVGGNLESASGTSFATAIVSGAAALIYSYISSRNPVNNLALATKAVIIASADSWGEDYPYRRTGFGYINLRKTLQMIDNVILFNISSGNKVMFSFDAVSSENLSICLVWQRVPTSISELSFYDTGTLKVSIFDPDGELAYNRTETINNVIKDVFKATKNGSHLLVVEKIYRSGESLLDNVALVSTKPLSRPKILSIAVPCFDKISDAEIPKVTLKVRNNADTAARNITLSVTITNAEPSIAKLNISQIESGGEVEVPLNMRFIKEGLVIIDANASYEIDGKKLSINNKTFFLGFDDDTIPPVIKPIYVDVSVLGDKITFEFRIQDESGINAARLYYRIDYPLDEHSLDLADDVLNLTYDPRSDLWKLEIKTKPEWNGKMLYYVVEAIDADNDRLDDSLVSYYSGKITVRVKVELIILMALLAILLAYAIFSLFRSRRKVQI
ncbi:MAG: S8 family serine peptidase [Candidatus Korarchaeota archaeon]